MTDLDYLFIKCKEAYYKGWTDEDIEDCKQKLQTLTHEELFELRNSRWMSTKSPLYPLLFSLLFKDQIELVATRLNSLSNEDLLKELRSTKNAIVKEKIPHILNDRFDEMPDEEKNKVIEILVKNELRIKTTKETDNKN